MSLNLEPIAKRISDHLSRVEHARERSFMLHREIIKKSGLTIRAVHRLDKELSGRMIKETAELLREAHKAIEGIEELPRSGFMHDAQKEFAEAATTYAIIFKEEMPDPEKLGVTCAAYLNGIAEAIGELRRKILDLIRQDREEEGEVLLEAMDEIFAILVTMDFSDAVTGGLRRTTDQSRGILERTRGDFTNHVVSRRLRADLNKHICQCAEN